MDNNIPSSVVSENPPIPSVTQPDNSHRLKILFIMLGVLVVIILVSTGSYYLGLNSGSKNITNSPSPTSIPDQGKACTQEAKICPDGSSVGRTGLNCEFGSCPEVAVIPTSIPDPTIDWKIYTNTKWNYSFKYPENFIVEEQDENICPTDDPKPLPSGYLPRIGACDENNKGDSVIVYPLDEKGIIPTEHATIFYIKITQKPSNYPIYPIDSECRPLKTNNLSVKYTVNDIKLGNDNGYEIILHTETVDPKSNSFPENLYELFIKQNYKVYDDRPQMGICGLIKDWIIEDKLINIAARSDNQDVMTELRQMFSTFKFI